VNAELKAHNKKVILTSRYPFYLSAWEEDKWVVAQATPNSMKRGNIVTEL